MSRLVYLVLPPGMVNCLGCSHLICTTSDPRDPTPPSQSIPSSPGCSAVGRGAQVSVYAAMAWTIVCGAPAVFEVMRIPCAMNG